MNYKKGKRIERPEEFVKGEKYIDLNGDVFTFQELDKDGDPQFKHEKQIYLTNKKGFINFYFKQYPFHQAIPEISREVYEEVLKDWNSFNVGARKLDLSDKKYLNHKFPKENELHDEYTGWVKDEDNDKWLAYVKNGVVMYGVNCLGNWVVQRSMLSHHNRKQPATPEEVYPRLRAEAERRGLVEGVEVECLFNGKIGIINIKDSNWKNSLEHGEFWMESNNGFLIRLLNQEGEWAKPITKLDRMIEELKQEAKRNDMDVDVVFK